MENIRVLAWGDRPAVAMTASLLSSAGAEVTLVPSSERPLLAGFDVIIVASDLGGDSYRQATYKLIADGGQIVCDITATGHSRLHTDHPLSDAEIQALTGVMDTTGFADGGPTPLGIPFTEISAAFYGASAIAVALRVSRSHNIWQTISLSLYGCAASSLTTFLPLAFVQKPAHRVGNRHPACAPWNAYPTQDGWVLLCTSTDEQWRRLHLEMAQECLSDPRFEKLSARVRLVDELDELMIRWSSGHTTRDCLALCERAGVPAGPIEQAPQLGMEPNVRLRHPGVAEALRRGAAMATTYQEVTTFRFHPLSPLGAAASPRDVPVTDPITGQNTPLFRTRPGRTGPLAGVKVVEIGQYTTAPLAGKHLAALGAQVIKIEAPEGEVSRGWSPGQSGVSYFFALNNTDKDIRTLDLKGPADRETLRLLLAEADILVENLRPGTLAKFGFDRASLAEINPKLVYCSISGFGVHSAYPERPAFDTVIQGMGGIMDLTRCNGVPVKLGISAADILGGQAALFAITVALMKPRDIGAFLEIAMQDVAVWSSLYAVGNPASPGTTLRCSDGEIWVTDRRVPEAFTQPGPGFSSETRAQAVRILKERSIQAVPIQRVDELMHDPDFLSDVISSGTDAAGNFWPIVKLPYRLSGTPGRISQVSGVSTMQKGAQTITFGL